MALLLALALPAAPGALAQDGGLAGADLVDPLDPGEHRDQATGVDPPHLGVLGAGVAHELDDALRSDQRLTALSGRFLFGLDDGHTDIVGGGTDVCAIARDRTDETTGFDIVVDGETGWLVPIEQVDDGTGTPVDPDRFVSDLAAALTDAVSDPERARRLGAAGRERAVEHFSWDAIAETTVGVYRRALAG